jgi:hypothetical protein
MPLWQVSLDFVQSSQAAPPLPQLLSLVRPFETQVLPSQQPEHSVAQS